MRRKRGMMSNRMLDCMFIYIMNEQTHKNQYWNICFILVVIEHAHKNRTNTWICYKTLFLFSFPLFCFVTLFFKVQEWEGVIADIAKLLKGRVFKPFNRQNSFCPNFHCLHYGKDPHPPQFRLKSNNLFRDAQASLSVCLSFSLSLCLCLCLSLALSLSL